jgi:hypothetical protein
MGTESMIVDEEGKQINIETLGTTVYSELVGQRGFEPQVATDILADNAVLYLANSIRTA